MSDRTTVMYYYDGTYNGFLSCVFESFAEKETPAAILPVDEADQTCLFGAKYIETDLRRAERNAAESEAALHEKQGEQERALVMARMARAMSRVQVKRHGK